MSELQIRDKRKARRFFVDNCFFRQGWARKIGPHGAIIYACLVMHASHRTQACWPSYETLAGLTGMSRRQAIRKVKELESLNIVHVERREGTSNLVSLLDSEVWGSDCESPVGNDSESLGGDSESPVTSDCESPKQNPCLPIKTQETNSDNPTGKQPNPEATWEMLTDNLAQWGFELQGEAKSWNSETRTLRVDADRDFMNHYLVSSVCDELDIKLEFAE